jgi:hypothetical protein
VPFGVVVESCSNARSLRALLDAAPAAVLQVRVLPVPSMFPEDLRDVVASIPFEVLCLVSPPSVVERAGLRAAATVGETLVFGRGFLIGRIAPSDPLKPSRLRGLLGAGLAPWLTPARAEPAAADPFDVIGVPSSASFEEVHAAWRRRLAEYHPDRFAQAGDKIRLVALSETQRINAAFRTIAEARRTS